jgi:tRNA A-37 threonylcarbamoyl transferase component Bud32
VENYLNRTSLMAAVGTIVGVLVAAGVIHKDVQDQVREQAVRAIEMIIGLSDSHSVTDPDVSTGGDFQGREAHASPHLPRGA